MRLPIKAGAAALCLVPLAVLSCAGGAHAAAGAVPVPALDPAVDLDASVSFLSVAGSVYTYAADGTLYDDGISGADAIAWSGDGSRAAIGLGQVGIASVLASHSELSFTVEAAASLGAVAWHPAGYEVASVVDEDGEKRVVRTEADGTGRTVAEGSATGGPADPTSLSYLFDGSAILLTDTGVAGNQLELLDVATGTSSRLVPDAAGAQDASQKDGVVSPDGQHIAYVQGSGADEAIWIMNVDGSNAVQVLAQNVADRGLAWTVDGLGLYFLTGSGGPSELRVVDAAEGSDSSLLRSLGVAATTLATRPSSQPTSSRRMSGGDRIATSVAISTATFAAGPIAGPASCEDGQALGVVLARSDLFPDGLVAGPLAADRCAPLLLTPPTSLDVRVLGEIDRLLAPGDPVYIIGSTGAISAATQTQLTNAGYQVTRFAGPSRYDTAVDVATRGLGAPETILLATGTNFPDALSAGPAAHSVGGAILLTNGTLAHPATTAYLQAHASTLWAIGGPAAQAYPSANAVSGPDRLATAVAVAQTFFYPPKTVFVANGYNFPDAMSGGARAARADEPLLLTAPASVAQTVSTLVQQGSASASSVVAFGGPSVVSDDVLAELSDLAEGSETWWTEGG